ncbi:MAG TPA: non-canonical purine NTP pyrophosphatase [Verrucomicrobiota bacterium]|nr:non-canonical purine NTP pyrophosphatase [Verrucomicrobiales bacterium]HRI15040.1 non-canonical purine NTP pyrophosphatase [Verrucomicrobiota bacterium]
MISLFVATGSAHKLREIRSGLGPGVTLYSIRDVVEPITPVEDAATFTENAAIKSVAWARYLAERPAKFTADFVLADDSGLEVDALGGQPGVHSARFAALDDGRVGNSPDAENNTKLIRLLAEVPLERRQARFRCVLALTPASLLPAANLAAQTRFFSGTCEGHLSREPVGAGGFGYDPLFVPEGYRESFAELGPSTKDQISHRARALKALRTALNLSA